MKRLKLLQLVYAIKELDPDIILTNAGDSYLFPYLIHRATINDIADTFILSRDKTPFEQKKHLEKPTFPMGARFIGQEPFGCMAEYILTKTTLSL